MNTDSLTGLIDFLSGALTPADMKLVGERLLTCAQKHQKDEEFLRPYTMDEINAMLDKAEEQAATGQYITNDELFRRWNERLEMKERLQKEKVDGFELAMAV